MKKHHNRHSNATLVGNETALSPNTANTPAVIEQQNFASRTTTQNEDPELRSFLCSKLPRKNAPELLIANILQQVNVCI